MDDYIYWLWLSLAGGVANNGYSLLLEHFGDARAVYEAELDDYARVDGLEKRLASRLMNKDLSRAEEIFDFCRSRSVRLLHCMEPDYPIKLKWTYAYPVLLYVYGTLPNLNEVLTVAVVGTRHFTDYGRIAAYRIGGGLARARSVVVSGMALGNDSIAQLAAVNNGGKTIAVMGTGIDRIYPSEHRELAKLISKNGALVTEFAPGTPPIGKNFPIRNRIISGLSDAVALIECPEKSGALITAKYATEQSRSIYAVPGDITSPTSHGPISLLKDGAKPITNAGDIIEDFVCQYSYLNSVMENTNFDVAVPKGVNTASEASLIPSWPKAQRYSDATPFDNAVQAPAKNGLAKFFTGTKPSETKKKKAKAQVPEIKKAEKKPMPEGLSELEGKLYTKISDSGRINAESLTDADTPTADVMSALTKLEILGIIKSQAGGFYMLAD
ncbi:MAG: DNA-processing protein DprA [Clostridia bacterium]|nr:DNA-processing protein DprA [Clostridia bacterium]